MRELTGIISSAIIPTSALFCPASLTPFKSRRKLVYGYNPMPIPCINSTGNRVFDVCGRYQYVRCLTGDLYVESSVRGRKGKRVKKRERGMR